MPVTYLHVQWPDETKDKIYSPSSIIGEYFESGESIALQEFESRISKALHAAMKRVEEVYGFECSSARAELSSVMGRIQKFEQDRQQIKIIQVG